MMGQNNDILYHQQLKINIYVAGLLKHLKEQSSSTMRSAAMAWQSFSDIKQCGKNPFFLFPKLMCLHLSKAVYNTFWGTPFFFLFIYIMNENIKKCKRASMDIHSIIKSSDILLNL